MFSNWIDPSSDSTFTKYFDKASECDARSSVVSLKAAENNTPFLLTASFWKFLKISRYEISDHEF